VRVSGETDLKTLLRTMQPEARAGAYEFVSATAPTPEEIASAIAVVHEDEGVTLVRPTAESAVDAMACITLTVHSSLQAVGLTAAVATALAERGIACNVVAGFHHDHLFVPWARRTDAIAALTELAPDPGCFPEPDVAQSTP